MNRFTPHTIALFLATLVLISALSVISLARWLSDTSQDTVTVRNVATVSLPPPPPPPPPPPQMEQPPIEMPTISLSPQGEGPQIEMSITPPEVEFTKPPLELHLELSNVDWQQNLEVDWQAFGLSDLDNLPTSLAKLKFRIPKTIRRSGIKSFDIVLDVMINEQGKVTLIGIKKNPYPTFAKEIKRIVKIARFTPPTKNGEAVKARFNWPIEVSNI